MDEDLSGEKLSALFLKKINEEISGEELSG
jgi:hypothetical protein